MPRRSPPGRAGVRGRTGRGCGQRGRSRRSSQAHFTKGSKPVNLRRFQRLGNRDDVRQDDAGQETRAARPGHRLEPGPGSAAHRAHQQPHGSLPGPRQGLPRATRPAAYGQPRPPPAGVLEAHRLAKQAAGSCLLQFGETVVLAAVTVSDNIANLPYFPLTVEYREKAYAAGKIPGGFLKREGRPSDEEITS